MRSSNRRTRATAGAAVTVLTLALTGASAADEAALAAGGAPGFGPQKDRGTAVALSFIPGAGHHYLGNHTRGLLMNGAFLAGLVMAEVGWTNTYQSGWTTSTGPSGWTYYDYANDGGGEEITAVGVLGYGLILGSIGWSVLDIVLSTSPAEPMGSQRTEREGPQLAQAEWNVEVSRIADGVAFGMARRF